ncbi:MAG: exodeoxyribonuclease VII small subunit [Verrucomicrobia bacterium]|nr:MAG: exodeoxyribonuclease VII small subunit [Verrucomicrobiota bacterium]TAE86646.1 MAG: exodeoxyribonuclease VII small subunit [Verrucomicrobiota bacterium]TAF24425.1 MAG: exodeoxyribonuclease VII small subunit [Verrucomicrobiota bacterium]TAF39986.1 MAG: exodeoxyribonuclease VII small subunit [Verrucomicrobiota bacterium]
MPARRKSNPGEPSNELPTFEAALAELEEIVAAMEEQQLPLEELVARYEKGSKLLARCESVLATAKKRLQTISARSTAEPVIDDESDLPHADFTSAGPAAGTPDEYDHDDDIRLF